MLRRPRHLQRQGRFAGWRYEGSQHSFDGNEVTIKVGGPEGLGVALTITATSKNGRSGVDADFDLSEGTEPSVARPAIEAMVEAMKSLERRSVRR